MEKGIKGRGIKNYCRFIQNTAVNSSLTLSPRHTPAWTLTVGGVGRDATCYSQGAGPSDSGFQNRAPGRPSREEESAVAAVTQDADVRHEPGTSLHHSLLMGLTRRT